MKFLKHILVAVAVWLMAMPCTHADRHDAHAHGDDAQQELCATHACACHTCDRESCNEELTVHQSQTAPVSPTISTPTSFTLLVFHERKTAVTKIPLSVGGVLASLQTIQLLI